MMQPLCYISLIFIFHPSVHSRQCDTNKQYSRQNECCNKCPPGSHMEARSESDCNIVCLLCHSGRYTSTYNLEHSCFFCNLCAASHQQLESPCNTTHDTVCRCEPGYRCTGPMCLGCERTPSISHLSSTVTKPATTNTLGTAKPGTTNTLGTAKPGTTNTLRTAKPGTAKPTPSKEINAENNKWFLVVVGVVCVVTVIAVATRLRPSLRWIRSEHGCFAPEKTPPTGTEEEKVSMPVQEMCGKCDQPIV
ncbi:tumor necrosis factor receptor superfamily member 4-like isoform X2 [Centroberyx affinis]|uniref:tumor necrosis factor receptor superfamily member 4-like isoform X2 n=1 Tax=Centroberyx affinis TaxID=166261 RepID=UPI003A5BC2A3